MMGTREFLGEETKEFDGENMRCGRREREREKETGIRKDDSKAEEDEAMDEEEKEELSSESLSWHEGHGGALLPCFDEQNQDVLKRITSETVIFPSPTSPSTQNLLH